MAMQRKIVANFVGREVLVVQTDGKALKGRLESVDDDCILLSNALETSTAELEWRQPKVVFPTGKSEKIVELKEVVVPFSSIVRLWSIEAIVPEVKPITPVKPKPAAPEYVVRRVPTV
jgi:small nuclear ribonucleoprotein (snRNP)-like protein